jgi:hypothetical protein
MAFPGIAVKNESERWSIQSEAQRMVLDQGSAEGSGQRVPDTTVNAMLVVAVRLPDFPVIVTVEAPAAAELAAANVTALLPDVTALKVAVTPLGSPDAENVTAPVKPEIAVMARLPAPLAPAVTLKLAGVAASVKPGGGLTVSAMVALLLKAPEVPVIVTVDVPAAAVLAAVRVSVPLPDLTAPRVAVTPFGNPDAASATVPVKPEISVMAMLPAPLAPGVTLKVVGVTASVKVGCGTMVRAMVTLAVRLPDVPVMVTVAAAVDALAMAVNVAVRFKAPTEVNVAVTPDGKPVAVKATAPLNPLCGNKVMVEAPVAP